MADGNTDFPVTPTTPSQAPLGYVTPAGSATPESPKSAADISSYRGQFWELALGKVVEAVQGFFAFGGTAFAQLQSWANTLWNAAMTAFNQIGQLITNVGGTVIGDVSAVINNVYNGLATLTSNLLNDAGAVIGAIPQTLVTGLTGAIGAINSAIGAATAFIHQVIDTIVSALRGIPIIGALIPDLSGAVKTQSANQQNMTISAVVSDNRNPSYVCRYPISDVTYPEFINNQISVFGTTDNASTGTAHTHTLNLTNTVYGEPAGWSVNQNESRGTYLTIAHATVHDTMGVIVWKDSGTLNNVYLEVFLENSDLSLTQVYSQEFSGSITTSTAFLEFTLPTRMIVVPGERYLMRVRNASSVATTVWLVGFTTITSSPTNVTWKTTTSTDSNRTSYTAAQAATAQTTGTTFNWFMLAAKSLPTVARSYSDDANRLSIGGMWVGTSSTASLLDIYEEAFGYTGTADGDQTAIYIQSLTQDVDRVEANLYINTASTARCGVMLHCARDFSQIVYLGVNGTSAKIYSGSATSLTERASLSSGGTGKWALYYDSSIDSYVALLNGASTGLQWTSAGSAVTHDSSHRFGGIRISSAGGTPAGTVDDWLLRDWYVAVPATVQATVMTATASMPDASWGGAVSVAAAPMTATISGVAPSVMAGAVVSAPVMTASIPAMHSDVSNNTSFPYVLPFPLA